MLALGLTVLFAAATPRTAVLVTAKPSVSATHLEALTTQVRALVQQQGVDVMAQADATALLGDASAQKCEGKATCLAELAQKLTLPGVVLMSVADVVGERIVSLTVIKSGEASAVFARRVGVRDGSLIDPLDLTEFLAFTKLVAVSEIPKGSPPSVPAVVSLAPTEAPVIPAAAVTEVLPERKHTTQWVLGSVGAGLFIAGVAMVSMGVAMKLEVDHMNRNQQNFKLAQARAAADLANTLPVPGIVSGVAGLALGATALITW